MMLKNFLRKKLSQRIYNIIGWWNSFYLYISSKNDIPNKAH